MVFHFNNIVNFNQQSLQQLVDNMAVWAIDNAFPCLPGDYEFQGLFGRSVAEQIGFVASNTDNAGLTGDDLGETSDGQSSICITTRTPFAGKSARGRKYWPGVKDARVANNRVEASWLTIVNTALSALIGIGNVGTNWVWVVRSLEFNKVPRAQGAVFTIVRTTATSDVVASQQRRKPKRS